MEELLNELEKWDKQVGNQHTTVWSEVGSDNVWCISTYENGAVYSSANLYFKDSMLKYVNGRHLASIYINNYAILRNNKRNILERNKEEIE